MHAFFFPPRAFFSGSWSLLISPFPLRRWRRQRPVGTSEQADLLANSLFKAREISAGRGRRRTKSAHRTNRKTTNYFLCIGIRAWRNPRCVFCGGHDFDVLRLCITIATREKRSRTRSGMVHERSARCNSTAVYDGRSRQKCRRARSDFRSRNFPRIGKSRRRFFPIVGNNPARIVCHEILSRTSRVVKCGIRII